MKTQKPKPKHMELWRAKICCKIARDSIKGEVDRPRDTSHSEYAIYQLAHAIEDIANHLEKVAK